LQETEELEVQNSEPLDLKSDKELLLEEYEKQQKRANNITFRELLKIYLIILIALLIILPKIYISNQIYYISKDLNSLYHEFTALQEEKAALLRELEKLRYKINVTDEMQETNIEDDDSFDENQSY